MIKSVLRPGDIFIHERVEAIVQVAARKSKTQHWLEQVQPTELWGEGDVAGLAVKRND